MTVQRIQRGEVVTWAKGILGLDSAAVDLFSAEGLCASLRRAASFLCPASPRQIVDAVLEALVPLSQEVARGTVSEALDALVMSGDLLELRQPGSRSRLLFLGPPSFVEKHPGEYLLLGIRPRAVALLGATTIDAEIIYDAHTRSVLLDADSGTTILTALGLHCMTKKQWTKAPRIESPVEVIEKTRAHLGAERSGGVVNGLTIIGAAGSGQFYKGRWREPNDGDDGIFTGRRPQAYGAPIWCAVDLAGGVPQAVLDLPVDTSTAPGWDEARRIQAALDADRGDPHVYRVRAADRPDVTFLDFFAPLPSWAERYLAISGFPSAKGPKSLFSYCLPDAATDDVYQFLSSSLWMTAIKEDWHL